MISGKELDAMQALCDLATPGPWERGLILEGYLGHENCSIDIEFQIRGDDPDSWDNGHRKANAAFISHARSDMPSLIAEVRRFHRVKEWIKKYGGEHQDGPDGPMFLAYIDADSWATKKLRDILAETGGEE